MADGRGICIMRVEGVGKVSLIIIVDPHLIHLDAGYWGLRLIAWIHAIAVIPWNRHSAEEPLLFAAHLDQRGTRQAHFHRSLLWPRLPVFSLTTPVLVGVVGHRAAGRLDLYRDDHGWPRRSTRGPS